MLRIAVVLILGFLGSATPALAEQKVEATHLVELNEYLKYAALHNAGLKSSFQQWKAAIAQVPQARSLPDPKFTFGYFIEEVETRVGPQRNKFGLMQKFPWFGEIEARTDAASAAAKAARKRYDAAKVKLFYDIKKGFYEYAYLGRSVQINRQNLELIIHFEEVARIKYTTATGSHPDIIRAQIELATITDKLESLEQMQAPVVSSLNSILNRKSDLPLHWPKRGRYKPLVLKAEQIIARLEIDNPQLQALRHEVVFARKNVVLAKTNFYPDISFGLDWIQTSEAPMSGTNGSGKDPIVAMLSLNLPIWTDSYEAGHRQAKAKLRGASARKTQMENDIIAKAMKVLYEFDDSARKVALYGDILVPKAKEMLSASEVAYQGGTVDFLSLIDAQRTLLGFELLYERAVTDNMQRLAEIEMLVGGELETGANLQASQ